MLPLHILCKNAPGLARVIGQMGYANASTDSQAMAAKEVSSASWNVIYLMD
jgi:hypothetical protein